MLPIRAYNIAHEEFPFSISYPNSQESCNHNFDFVVYCDGETDIVRCNKCGLEIETRCSFDDECD